MFVKKLTALTLAMAMACAAVPTQAGLPGLPGKLGDKVDKATGMDKCKDDDDSCKAKAKAKEVAAVAAVGVAATLIAKMVIKAKSERVNSEDEVIAEYKKTNKTLPPQAKASDYQVTVEPNGVIKPGTDVKVRSKISVIRGLDTSEVVVEERLNIYDNVEKGKVNNTFVKPVNDNKRAGRFTNEFTFTLDKGLEDGVYPLENQLMLDGKVVNNSKSDVQLALVVKDQSIRVASIPRQ